MARNNQTELGWDERLDQLRELLLSYLGEMDIDWVERVDPEGKFDGVLTLLDIDVYSDTMVKLKTAN